MCATFGLFSTLELVTNRESKGDLRIASVMGEDRKPAQWIVHLHHGKQHGKYGLCRPAAVHHQEQLDEGMAIVDKALEVADNAVEIKSQNRK